MKEYWVAFSSAPNIKTSEWRKILNHFPDLKTAWNSCKNDFLKSGIRADWVDRFFCYKNSTNPSALLDEVYKKKVNIICINEESYPKNLREIYSPPFVLYVKGDLTQDDVNSVAIVGSRKGTDYGKRATYEIAKELAFAKIIIISGLALGLDSEAHKGALDGEGRTIAVLANGLGSIYPSSNTNLAKKISENGCLISEQPLNMPALKQNFPARNRIISGMALGVLISEAGENSGTLHTASFAIEQNRQVYAIPGPIYNPLAIGPNNLLKHGAKPVTEAQDILEDFGIEKTKVTFKPEGKEEEIIFSLLKNKELHIDKISNSASLPIAKISKILTMMEIKGKVRHLGGMIYSLK